MCRAVEREFETLEEEIADAKHAASRGADTSGGSRRGTSSSGGREGAAKRREAHRNALAKLRPHRSAPPSAATLLAAGAACGAAACVLANVCALLARAHSFPEAAAYVAALLPVLRGPLLLLCHVALYGAAVAAWSRFP